ncbi:MAG TPA: hypothetical protein VHM20_04790, partial [Gammaproteobacteria bacterium]|nr:hypothetical protein [Gammaproteobacteria bacterium]
KNDPYCCRVITERSRAALLEIEKLYWKKNIISNAPALYIYPKEDPLVDLPAAHNIYMEMTAGKGFLFQIPANLHYMWFSEYRFQLANCVSHFVLSNGYSL